MSQIKDFTFSPVIRNDLPETRVGLLNCRIEVASPTKELVEKISTEIETIRSQLSIEEISKTSLIRQTREAYRILGKDPARYRPSAEALTRRVVQGKGLYQVNNVVDLLNLVSVTTGFSIGGYDEKKIIGSVTLDTGKENEPYPAIGRGELNIHLLPVLRDEQGPFGSPTSDSARTMIRDSTNQFLMVFFDFFRDNTLSSAMERSALLLEKYAAAENLEIRELCASGDK